MKTHNPLYNALVAKGNETKIAILDVDGSPLPYTRLKKRTEQFARALHFLQLKKGDRVAVQVEKSAEVICLYLACIRQGLIFLPLNTAYTVKEITWYLSDAQPRLFITDSIADSYHETTASGDHELLTLDLAALQEMVYQSPPLTKGATCLASDTAAMLYTSGTTGKPKGAMLSHGALLSNAKTLIDTWKITQADELLHALPIYHVHGLFVAVNTLLLARATIRLLSSFNTDSIFANLPTATCFMGVPTFYTRLLADPRCNSKSIGHLRLVVSGSAPLLAATHREFTQKNRANNIRALWHDRSADDCQ